MHQKETGPESEDDENKEEVRVYTDTDQRRWHHNIRLEIFLFLLNHNLWLRVKHLTCQVD